MRALIARMTNRKPTASTAQARTDAAWDRVAAWYGEHSDVHPGLSCQCARR